jgi:hypothetical protein
MPNVNSPEQFKLFMTGTEWQGSVTHSTDGPISTLWAEKEARAATPSTTEGAHGSGVRSSIERYGYQHDRESPPTIILEDAPNGKSVRRVQSEGHHRVAAAAAIERDTGNPVFIPTNYVDNTSAGRRARKEPRGVRMVHGANALHRSGEAGGK